MRSVDCGVLCHLRCFFDVAQNLVKRYALFRSEVNYHEYLSKYPNISYDRVGAGRGCYVTFVGIS